MIPCLIPHHLVGLNPSTGTKGKLWGIKVDKDLCMLLAWSPPIMSLEKKVRCIRQPVLGCRGSPGTSLQGSDNFGISRLSDAFLMMVMG